MIFHVHLIHFQRIRGHSTALRHLEFFRMDSRTLDGGWHNAYPTIDLQQEVLSSRCQVDALCTYLYVVVSGRQEELEFIKPQISRHRQSFDIHMLFLLWKSTGFTSLCGADSRRRASYAVETTSTVACSRMEVLPRKVGTRFPLATHLLQSQPSSPAFRQ